MDKPACVINPKTGRAVKSDSKLGKQILAGKVKKEPKEPNTMYKKSSDVKPNREDFKKKKQLEKYNNRKNILNEYKIKLENFIDYFSMDNLKTKIKFGSHYTDAKNIFQKYNELYKEIVNLEKMSHINENGTYDSTQLLQFKKDNKKLMDDFENNNRKVDVVKKLQKILSKMKGILPENLSKVKQNIGLLMFGNLLI